MNTTDLTKHTPGPWHLMETEPGIVAEMDVFVTTPRWAGGIGLIARVMNADDAVLIAAAPDLLAVLKAVADDGVAMRGFHEQFRAEIHAVIAKATGESK